MSRESYRFFPALLLLIAAPDAPAQISFRTVSATGEQAPGNPVGINFLSFQFRPTINNSGAVTFSAMIPQQTGGSTRQGIWSDTSGQLQGIAQKNSPAPTHGTTYGSSFTSSNISDNGDVAFCGSVYPPPISVGSDGVLVNYSLGQGSIVAYDWQLAPGTPANNRFGSVCTRGIVLVPPAMNADGQVSFYSQLLSAPSPGIWKTAPSGTLLVARSATPAPGTGPNANFAEFGTPDLSVDYSVGVYTRLNDTGNTAFFATLAGSAVTSENNRGIWQENSGSLSLVVRSSDTPSGFSSSTHFADFGDPALNNAGHLAFRANLVGTSIDASNDTSIWSNASGAMSLVAREGSQAPGLSPGVVFGQMQSAPLNDVILDGKDDIAFISALAGNNVTPQNDAALWAQRNGVLGLIAREGDPAPGMPQGSVFADTNFGFFYPQMNDPGQMVFKASISGPGINSLNDEGYWAVLPDGNTFPIVRESDVVEVRPGDFRTISGCLGTRASTGGQDGLQRTLNDFGEFTFLACFTDGSQAILVATIPEPSTVGLLAGAWIALLGPRRRSPMA